jgi:hypothetical protein
MNCDVRTFLVCAPLMLVSVAVSGSTIDITRPAASVRSGTVIIEGTVETETVRKVSITAEPFVGRGTSPVRTRADVREGRFAGSLELAAGIYLLRVTAGAEEFVRPIFIRDAARSAFDRDAGWGVVSPVLFAAPRDVRTSRTPVEFQGLVNDDAVRALDVIVVGAESLSDAVPGAPAVYRRVRVERRTFAFTAVLSEGLNLILAKPAGMAVSPAEVQLKSVIYERTGAGLTIEEPIVVKNRLVLNGAVADPSRRTVLVRISALVEQKDAPGDLRHETVLERSVTVKSDGTFSAVFPWEPERGRVVVRSFPVIRVYAGEEVVSRTLVRWW